MKTSSLGPIGNTKGTHFNRIMIMYNYTIGNDALFYILLLP